MAKKMLAALAILGAFVLYPCLSQAMPEMPMPELKVQSWGKVDFMLLSGQGFSTGYYHDVKIGTDFAYMSKAGVGFLKRTIILEIGGLVTAEGKKCGVTITPAINIGGVFSALGVHTIITDRWTFGYSGSYYPKALLYDKGYTHWGHGVRTGITVPLGGK